MNIMMTLRGQPNKRLGSGRTARPTRKIEALLFAAEAGRQLQK